MVVEPDREVGAAPTAELKFLLEFAACPDCCSNLEINSGGLRCTKCHREFETRGNIPILLPRSSDVTERRYLANYQAMATDDLAKAFEGNRPARHEKLKEFVGSVANKRVLDIGSSDATYLRQMDARIKVALDIAIEYLEQIPGDSGVLGVCGDAEQLPIKAGYFDVVIVSDVLEHVLHPERVAEHLLRISRPDTRLIVHVPWEEDLSQYRDVPYEFTHLRSFDAFTFGHLFKDFYEIRSRGTYPHMTAPLQYRLYGMLPRNLYNNWIVFTRVTGVGDFLNRKWAQWIAELPRRERWLLLFYRPIFRQFELRPLSGTLHYRFVRWLRRRLKRLGR